jgi:hypothetical protein
MRCVNQRQLLPFRETALPIKKTPCERVCTLIRGQAYLAAGQGKEADAWSSRKSWTTAHRVELLDRIAGASRRGTR